MANRSLPAIVFTVAAIGYTIWFFHDFPSRSKESVARLLASAEVVELCFDTPVGNNKAVRVNDTRDLIRLSAAFEKATFISMPNNKRTIFGRAVFSTQGKEALRMDFCSFPVVLIDGRSYALSPDFTLLARSLAEEGNKHE